MSLPLYRMFRNKTPKAENWPKIDLNKIAQISNLKGKLNFFMFFRANHMVCQIKNNEK